MDPLAIPELCSSVLSHLHPYEGMTSLYVCKKWNFLFKSLFKGNLQVAIKESLLQYPILPASFRYHSSLELFDRACQLGYNKPINYINSKEAITIRWHIRLSCICFRHNNIQVLEAIKNKYSLTMINVMKRRIDPSVDDLLKVPAGCFKYEDTIRSDYFTPLELAEYVIIYKSIYPYIANETFDGLVGLPVEGIHSYYSIGEQLRKKIGMNRVISLCNKYLPQVHVLDPPLIIIAAHKAKNLSWMKLD